MGLANFFYCPLINDYNKKKDRGKAAALYTVGVVFGDLLTFGIVYNFTESMDPIYSYGLASIVASVLVIILLFLIKEPNIKKI